MSRRRVVMVSAVLPLLATLAGRPAAAQDLAAAEALFKKGVTELEAGHYDVACPALAESQRIDPRPGTVFTLADCHDKAGRIATASALYEDYLRAVARMTVAYKLRHADRAKVATAREAALAAEIPELTLMLPASAPKDVRVIRDGIELMAASLGMPLPLDPGEHVVTTQVAGGPVVEQRITLARGERKTVEVEVKVAEPELVAAPSPAPPPPSRPATMAPSATVSAARSAPSASTVDAGMSGRRIGAFIAGGLGVAGLALGGVTGAVALSKKSTIEEHCLGTVCDAEGKAAADDAKLPGLLSTVGFGVGIAGLTAGIALWWTEPSPGEVGGSPRGVRAMVDIGPAGATAGVKGVW
jgi:hypothetical protein